MLWPLGNSAKSFTRPSFPRGWMLALSFSAAEAAVKPEKLDGPEAEVAEVSVFERPDSVIGGCPEAESD